VGGTIDAASPPFPHFESRNHTCRVAAGVGLVLEWRRGAGRSRRVRRELRRDLPSMLIPRGDRLGLYISVNLAKSHMGSIYRKFGVVGVVGRRDAVRQAHQLQLLRS
jgi:hypothetical protein